MEGSDETGRVARPQHHLDIPNFSSGQIGLPMRQLSPSPSSENSKRLGIPPSHPNNPMRPQLPSWQMGSQNLSSGGSAHSRSLSQPSFFSLDSLPPLSPLTSYREPSASSLSDPNSVDVSMEESVVNSHAQSLRSPVTDSNPFWAGDGLPPRRGHRRSNSDVPLGFSAVIQSSPQLIPIGRRASFDGKESLGIAKPGQLVRQGSNGDGSNNGEVMGDRKSGGEVVDDLFSAYMNLENIDKMNEDKDLDSRASGSKTNGGESSDNEVESGLNGKWSGSGFLNEKREGVKRTAGGDVARTVRHCRSVSMDSYMDNLNFDEELLKPLPLGSQVGQQSPSASVDGNSAKFSMEFGSGEFNAIELKKIMESEKLSEIAVSDPKRAKRILANRQSAARSKERKMRYIVELEHKVQTLQTEATTLSAQVTKLQRDSMGLTSENNELKFRLQALEQQAQLKDALNEALTGEVQRLRISAAELGGEGNLSNRMSQQLSINQQMLQLQQLNLYQMQQQPQQQTQQQIMQQPQQNQLPSHQQNGNAAKHESMQ
ncbi:putative transcription factor bZIP family [Rosa chinensis]|uniref:Putative transcription factor bZIP family n=1 Tax=Rosa chinensis TaxID=74649 RepID=A0A2P6PZ33_ROSCH|nr:bZIP transcription factor 29 [Rosa chinensis]PRQ27166.1 putative transcription factor bZIP family [Rosa chinensis]